MARLKLKVKKDQCSVDENPAKFIQKAKLTSFLERGLDIKEAAKLCNINNYTLGILRSDPEFEEFIEKCSVECESRHLENIDDAGRSGQWQASAWYLERKYPEKYGKKDTVKHEFELKFHNFQKIVLDTINQVDPHLKALIMQKLRGADIDSVINSESPKLIGND